MTLSVSVFDFVRVRDIFVGFFKKIADILPVHFVFDEDQKAKETEEKPVDNNSPGETLGIGITEEVKTREALS